MKTFVKTSITHSEYQRLELISDSQSANSQSANSQSANSQSANSQSANSRSSSASSPAVNLRNIWQSLLSYLSARAELRVWTTHSAGQLVWTVYDPVTQTRSKFVSELDLRIWLEERYYQTPAMPFVAR